MFISLACPFFYAKTKQKFGMSFDSGDDLFLLINKKPIKCDSDSGTEDLTISYLSDKHD